MQTDLPGSTADAFKRLISIIFRHSHQNDLTRGQWIALRYFGRACSFSRTVTAFAHFHAITPSGASQVIKGLCCQGLLEMSRNTDDKRITNVEVTEAGLEKLKSDPLHRLEDAISSLPAQAQIEFASTIFRLIDELSQSDDIAAFGTCSTCVYHKETADVGEGGSTHQCKHLHTTIQESDLHKICMHYEEKVSPFQN